MKSWTRTKIAKEIQQGLSLKEIQKLHTRTIITQADIDEIKKTSLILKNRIINGITYKKCPRCENLKPFTKEYFYKNQTTLHSICKDCNIQIIRNKRIIKRNLKLIKKYYD